MARIVFAIAFPPSERSGTKMGHRQRDGLASKPALSRTFYDGSHGTAEARRPFRAGSSTSAYTRQSRMDRLRELIKQRLRLLQIGRLEAFREPFVDRSQDIAGLRALALLGPEAGEADGGAEFPELGALVLR
jgi:hypothetical protein